MATSPRWGFALTRPEVTSLAVAWPASCGHINLDPESTAAAGKLRAKTIAVVKATTGIEPV
jgi:hypothetical protein